MRRFKMQVITQSAVFLVLSGVVWRPAAAIAANDSLDVQLRQALAKAGFSGYIESTLTTRLGRQLDARLANLGRLLWFDVVGGLHGDNTCGGCHSPTNGFGDTQSIAIGIQNNNLVGQRRAGPRNQRRSPMISNTAFYPALMWNARFFAPSGDPFQNSQGFTFPAPEGSTRFPPSDPLVTHLLMAQGQLPPTEQIEVAGFTGTKPNSDPRFDQFDDGKGSVVPPPDASGFRNEPIRQALLRRLNALPAYRALFGAVFPSVAAGGPIDFVMFGKAIAEFEFTLVSANAPVDQFARGDSSAMTVPQKKGALVFFGKGNCVSCHAVAGESNEMFSDFKMHCIGVPQIAPAFGVGRGNVIFDGPGGDEDFGREQITGDADDRYEFRTAPLRNVALAPAFFHNGAFTRLEDAIRHHLDVFNSARNYNPVAAGVNKDLLRVGPIELVLRRVDPAMAPVHLMREEFESLVAFVRDGLLDPKANKRRLCELIPASVPSGSRTMQFEACPTPK